MSMDINLLDIPSTYQTCNKVGIRPDFSRFPEVIRKIRLQHELEAEEGSEQNIAVMTVAPNHAGQAKFADNLQKWGWEVRQGHFQLTRLGVKVGNAVGHIESCAASIAVILAKVGSTDDATAVVISNDPLLGRALIELAKDEELSFDRRIVIAWSRQSRHPLWDFVLERAGKALEFADLDQFPELFSKPFPNRDEAAEAALDAASKREII